jgi:hypothetical protein
MHKEELHNLFFSTNTITMMTETKMRLAEHVARMGAKGNTYRVSEGKPQGKRLQRRPGCRWEDKIKMNLRQRG